MILPSECPVIRRSRFFSFAFLALLTLSWNQSARSEVVKWSGSIGNSSDPFGNAFRFENPSPVFIADSKIWFLNTQGGSYLQGEENLIGFEVDFFGLPEGVGFSDDQAFWVDMIVVKGNGVQHWDWTSLSPTSGRFDPQSPDGILKPMEQMEIQIGIIDQGGVLPTSFERVRFEAHYETASVPEPSAATLAMAFGLIRLLRRRRRPLQPSQVQA